MRAKAVEQAERFGFRQLLPRLEAMMASQAQNDVQNCLALHVPLLRDGFRLEPNSNGSGYWLAVRAPKGALRAIPIPADRFCDSYLRETVEQLKKGERIR